MFANLFKPKWRHSSPEVRARAVARLRTSRPAHNSILRQLLLDDSSSAVREAALVRVEDPALLLQVIQREADAELKARAAAVLCDTLEGLPASERQPWLDRLTDDSVRAELVLAGGCCPFKSLLLEAISDQRILLTLAQRAATAALRRTAALKIDDPALLEQLQRDTRGSDKAVHRIARERLQRYREAEREREAQAEKRQQLRGALEHLVNSEDRQQFQARFDLLLREWQQLPAAEPAVETDFQRLADQARAILAELKAEQTRQQLEEQARSEHQQHCEALAEQLESLVGDTQETLPDSALLAEQLAAAEQLREDYPLPPRLQDQLQSARQLQQALQRLEAQREALENALDGRDRGVLKKLLADLAWPQSLPLPSLLRQAEKRLQALEAEAAQQRALAEQESRALEADLRALENAMANGEIRVALAHQDQAGEQLRRLNGRAPEPLEQRYRSLCARLKEMKDWQGFAVNSKKEALCEQMEALIDSDLPPRPLAERIRQLQKEWKALDATAETHSQRLWQRFRTAAETAYAPCEAHFAAQRQQREENLRQREEICAQLEAFLQTIDWDQADWPAVERICHTAKREWKQFTPVDRAPGKQVQQRFNQVIHELDARLRDWHQGCADAKQALIDRAAILAEQEDVQGAAQEAKALQRQWKGIGPAFRSQERALWQAFRGHCDAIFTRLKEGSAEPIELADGAPPLGKEQLEQFRRSSELLNQAEKAIVNGDTALLDPLLDAIRASCAATVHPWDERLARRVDRIETCLHAPEALPQELVEAEREVRELCIRLEILLGQPSPEEDQAQRMEYQMRRLQQALEEQDRAPSRTDVLELDLQWNSLAFNALFPELRQRFEQLMRRTGC